MDLCSGYVVKREFKLICSFLLLNVMDWGGLVWGAMGWVFIIFNKLRLAWEAWGALFNDL